MAKKFTVETEIKGVDHLSKPAHAAGKSLDQLAGEALKTAKAGGKAGEGMRKAGAGVEKAGRQAEKAKGAFGKLGDFLKNRFVITLGDVARFASAAMDKIVDIGRVRSQTNVLKIELEKQGLSYDAFIGKLDDVARGTLSTAELIGTSSRALLLGIPADEIVNLLDVARVSATAMGKSTAEAFEEITAGIAKAEPEILENLGLNIKLGEVYAKTAKSLGVSATALTLEQKSRAILNTVLEIGKKRIDSYGEAQDKLGEAIAQGTATFENFSAEATKLGAIVGVSLTRIVLASAAGFLYFAKGVTEARIAWNGFIGDTDKVTELHKFNSAMTNSINEMRKMSDEFGVMNDMAIDELFGVGAESASKMATQVASIEAATVKTTAAVVKLKEVTKNLTTEQTRAIEIDLENEIADMVLVLQDEVEQAEYMVRQFGLLREETEDNKEQHDELKQAVIESNEKLKDYTAEIEKNREKMLVAKEAQALAEIQQRHLAEASDDTKESMDLLGISVDAVGEKTGEFTTKAEAAETQQYAVADATDIARESMEDYQSRLEFVRGEMGNQIEAHASIQLALRATADVAERSAQAQIRAQLKILDAMQRSAAAADTARHSIDRLNKTTTGDSPFGQGGSFKQGTTFSPENFFQSSSPFSDL